MDRVFTLERVLMPKKTFQDFNYPLALKNLKKKVPSFSKRIFPLYKVVYKQFNCNGIFYWRPSSSMEISKVFYKWIEDANKRKIEKSYTYNTGGLLLELEVTSGVLKGTLGVSFTDEIYLD